jgi:hypothetical protein
MSRLPTPEKRVLNKAKIRLRSPLLHPAEGEDVEEEEDSADVDVEALLAVLPEGSALFF